MWGAGEGLIWAHYGGGASSLKGLLALIKLTLHAKMAMPDLQQYPWNLKLIKNNEDIAVFLLEKCLI